MLDWCVEKELPVHVLLTKADKLKRGPASSALLQVKKYTDELGGSISVQLFSSLKNTGVKELVKALDHWFDTLD